jgi:hypothetical protein
MIIVRVIFVEMTRPVRMRPRMETSLVNGHFLSVLTRIIIVYGLFQQSKKSARTDISSVYRLGGCLESKSHILIPTLFLRRHLLSTCPSQTPCGQTCPGEPSLETRHTTSLRILEEGLLLKCFFNLQEVAGRLKMFRRDKLRRTWSAIAIVLRASRGECPLIEDYFQLTISK